MLKNFSVIILLCLGLINNINCGTFTKGGLSALWTSDGETNSMELNVDTKTVKSKLDIESMWSAVGLSADTQMVTSKKKCKLESFYYSLKFLIKKKRVMIQSLFAILKLKKYYLDTIRKKERRQQS
jgi:hypothetical protein